jgi:hypothetical protein
MIETITARQVAIVCLETDVSNNKLLKDLGHPAPRVVYYTVTLDPSRVSPDGVFVRFGQWGDGLGQADEITGWIPLDELIVEEILAEWDGKEFRPYVVESAVRAA